MNFKIGQIVAVIFEHGLNGEKPTTDNVFGKIVKIELTKSGGVSYTVQMRDGSTYNGSEAIVALP